MKTVLIAVGKTVKSYYVDAIHEYMQRIKHYIPFEFEIIPELKNTKNISETQQKEREADLILKAIQPGDWVVLLDEAGREFRSLDFATWIERKLSSTSKRLVFIIGGPYGFSQRIYEVASEKLSLSKMTFSHQMIRLVFLEQLYRAMTILRGEPYHHE